MGFQLVYAGRIYPGVSIAGIDLGGKRQNEAAVSITEWIEYPVRGRILLRDGERSWMVSPQEMGLYLDADSTARRAIEVGRKGLLQRLEEQFSSLFSGYELSPTLVFDQRVAYQYLSNLKSQIDQAVVEAQIFLEGTDVVVRSGQNGRSLNTDATMDALINQIGSLQDGVVDMKVDDIPAIIIDASEQADVARNILSQPLTLTLPEGQPDEKGPWVIQPIDLAAMLRFERVITETSEQYQVTLNGDSMRAFLAELAPSLLLNPENTRFIFNDESHQLEVMQPAVIGRRLDIEASVSSIQQHTISGEHSIPLEFEFTSPAITDQSSAEELGIRELVSSETTYFYGSDTARIQNIAAAAARFHGIMVSPGSTFSTSDALGDISLDNGYAEAWIIYDNQTIKGVGGGVCQVSTTLFRTAFFGGYPIVERHPHAYRVYYYEQTREGRNNPLLAGLDATVYVPVVDFKFTNDTPYWLLMETYVDPGARYITWKFYSTSDGRTVEWKTTGPENIVEEPEAVYKENPELEKGEIKQVDWGVEGADVTVTRTVERDGNVYFKDTITTHYKPWRDVYEYGPGTEDIPEPGEENEETNQ